MFSLVLFVFCQRTILLASWRAGRGESVQNSCVYLHGCKFGLNAVQQISHRQLADANDALQACVRSKISRMTTAINIGRKKLVNSDRVPCSPEP